MRALDVRRITGLEALLWTAATVIPLILLARTPDAEDVVGSYLAAVERGDVDAILGMWDGEPSLHLPFALPYMGVDAARDALQWRAATGWRMDVGQVLEYDSADRRLALEVRERSRVLDLLGVDQLYHAHYRIRGGRIQVEMWIPADRGVHDTARYSLKTFARWIKARYPEEREVLFAGDRPRWTGETAALWLSRLEEWRGPDRDP